MAMKDILGRFKKGPEEEFIPEEEFVPEEAPVDEKPSFVFTDINSEPIDTAEPVPEAPVHNGPVKVGSSDNDRIQMFEIDLGGSHVKLPEEPVVEAPAVEEPVYETYAPAPEPVYTPAPEPEVEDTIVVAPTPEAAGAEDDYEVDFGYSAPGALDDVTYTTDPAAVPKPAEPEPVVYTRSEAPAADDEEYYDSYEPMFEESYGPGSYFAGGEPAAPAAPVEEDYVPYEAPAAAAAEVAEPVEEVNTAREAETYSDDQPRYENYRKARNKARYEDEPRSYENNIDDSVFLPDEGDTPVFSRKNRRRLTIAIIAVLAALLIVLAGVLISHFTGNKDAETATTVKVKTTAFERSVSNNASATETTTEEEVSAQYDENGEISESTASTSYSSTSRRTSTRTTTRSTTASTTRSTTRSTTASTTQPTSATQPSTVPSTAVPSTQPSTNPTTQAPSPWDHVNN